MGHELRRVVFSLGIGHVLLCAGVMAVFSAQRAAAQDTTPGEEEAPLLEQEPYDQITLKSGETSVIKVEPIRFANGRQLPSAEQRRGKLRLRLLDAPDQVYELDWSQVADIKLFEQLILDEASGLVASGQLDEAFDYFRYLDANQPEMPGLDDAYARFLMEDAKRSASQGQLDMAQAVLLELHRRDPRYAGLSNALGAVTLRRINQHIADQQYGAVRMLLAGLVEKYPTHEVAAQVQRMLNAKMASALDTARAQMDAGEMTAAYSAAVGALAIVPDSGAARDLLTEINRRHPLVIVGVTSLAGAEPDPTAHDWANSRAGRLIHRKLVEFTGYGPDGGEYESSVAQIAADDTGQTLLIDVKPGLTWSDGQGEVTGYDVAGRMLALADPARPETRPAWTRLLASVTVRQVYQVEVTLARRHVRPMSLLDMKLMPKVRVVDSDRPPPTFGPYVAADSGEREQRFLANPYYQTGAAGQPREIVERVFDDDTAAVAALASGQVSVIDRVSPWLVDGLEANPEFIVSRYAVPTVHCLLPNLNKKYTARRSLRRALVYGINRQGILDGVLLRSSQTRGSRVISGPFPAGVELDDPLGYAYNELVDTRPYEPRLAITLAGVAMHEVRAESDEADQTALEMPELVLAHPPHPIARMACQAIGQQLKRVGIPIVLQELDGRETSETSADYDLLYTEWIVREPIVDAVRLLRRDGAVKVSSPHLQLALEQLMSADDWASTRRKLQEVHRLAHDDVSVIPLWQLTEHFAYHRGLEGVSQQPAWLYQNVEQWRPNFRLPAVSP